MEGRRIIFGKEMRGGLEGGHTHISFSSTPVLKGPGTNGDCPACLEWAEELAGDGRLIGNPYPEPWDEGFK